MKKVFGALLFFLLGFVLLINFIIFARDKSDFTPEKFWVGEVITLMTSFNFILRVVVYFSPLIIYCFFIFISPQKNHLAQSVRIFKKKFSKKVAQFFFLRKNHNFPELDGARAIAISMVMITHMNPWLQEMISSESASWPAKALYNFLNYFPLFGINGGFVGVNIFFVLSGFLIFMSITRKRVNFGQFMMRRYLRLLPVHMMLLLGLLAELNLLGIFLNVFFLVSFFPQFHNLNLNTWAISYEIIFYLIAASWFILGRKSKYLKTWKFFFSFIAFLYISQFALTPLLATMNIKYLEMDKFLSFFFGVGLAKVYLFQKKFWQKFQAAFANLAIPGLMLICTFQYIPLTIVRQMQYGRVLYSLSWLSLNVGIFLFIASLLVEKTNLLKQILQNKGLRITGIISYSIFLFHYNFGLPIANKIVQDIFFLPSKMILFVFASFVISIFFSVFLFYFLERPYFSGGKKLKNG